MEGDEAHSGPRLQVVYKEAHVELVDAKRLNRRRSRRQQQLQQQLSIERALGGGPKAKAGADEPPLVPRAIEEVLLLDSFRPAPRGSALASTLVGEGSPSGRCGRRVGLSLQHPIDHAHILALTKVPFVLELQLCARTVLTCANAYALSTARAFHSAHQVKCL